MICQQTLVIFAQLADPACFSPSGQPSPHSLVLRAAAQKRRFQLRQRRPQHKDRHHIPPKRGVADLLAACQSMSNSVSRPLGHRGLKQGLGRGRRNCSKNGACFRISPCFNRWPKGWLVAKVILRPSTFRPRCAGAGRGRDRENRIVGSHVHHQARASVDFPAPEARTGINKSPRVGRPVCAFVIIIPRFALARASESITVFMSSPSRVTAQGLRLGTNSLFGLSMNSCIRNQIAPQLGRFRPASRRRHMGGEDVQPLW